MAMPGLRRFVVVGAALCLPLGAAARSAAAEGPSFDCTAAMTRVESMICQDGQLSALDLSMSRAYARLLDATRRTGRLDHVRRLRREQKAWLAERNACEDYKCVVAAYERRIEHLAMR